MSILRNAAVAIFVALCGAMKWALLALFAVFRKIAKFGEKIAVALCGAMKSMFFAAFYVFPKI